jgi:hypothetical protein
VSGNAHPRIACVSSFWLALHLLCGTADAQAWVPARGEGSVSLTYQNYDVAGHFDVQGHKNTNGGTKSHALVTELDYGVTDTFGLNVSLPFIASKYTGPPSYFVGTHLTLPGPLDDGTYHAAFQDLRIEVRRLIWAGPVALAPFVGASFPTHDYETVGEAVPGRHRRDLQFGTNAGADLDRLLPGLYVQGRYAYGIAERVNNFSFTRSNIDLEGGYAVISRVVIRGLMNQQIRHQGPSLDELAADWVNHDRFIAPSYINLGGGTSVSLTRSTEIYALWVATASGSNGAHRERTLAIGITLGMGSGLRGLGGTGGSTRQAIRSSPNLMERFP